MWTLILFGFFFHANDSAITVPGYSSRQSCEAAASVVNEQIVSLHMNDLQKHVRYHLCVEVK